MSKENKSLYEFGDFRFDAKMNTLWRDSELISLSPKATDLLKLLIERSGDVVSKQEIMDVVWADTFVEDGVLTQNIYTLRQILGSDANGSQLIANIPRKGYRLTVPVKKAEETSPILETDEAVSVVPSSRMHPGIFISLGLISLAAILLIGFYFVNKSTESSPQKTTNELRFKQLTDTGEAGYLTISPDGNLAAYSDGTAIFIKEIKTNIETKLNLENSDKFGCLQFSPDGNFVYYGTLFNRDDKGSINRILRDGGQPEKITDDVWSGFSLSPDGTSLAFVRKYPAQNKQELIIRNLNDNKERSAAAINLPEEFYWNNYPAWSANGKRIAMVAVNQTEHFSRLLLVNSDTGEYTDFKTKKFRNVEQVVWNSDGTSLFAAANEGTNFQIWKIGLEDGATKRITNDLNSYLGIAISQDRKSLVSRQRIYFSNIWISGKDNFKNLRQITGGSSRNDGLRGLNWLDEDQIVYSTNDEKIRDWNLWLLNTTDGSKQKLTADLETQNEFPVVSPNKSEIYFASDRKKESRIWRINIDGSNPKQITFGEDETHNFPQISPDGKWVYFIIKSGRNSTIGRKSLTDNSVQEISGKTSFIPGNFLQLSPDGSLLAFQNIGYKAADEKSGGGFQIAIMPTGDPDKTSLYTLPAWQQRFIWNTDNKSFYYIGGSVKTSSLLKVELANQDIIETIIEPNETNLFGFAFSPSGEKLAVARGRLLRDVVLLTNFE